MKSRFQKIRMFLKRKKQKFDSEPKRVSNLMNGKCVCETPCNEYCDSKKQEEMKRNLGGGRDGFYKKGMAVAFYKPISTTFNSTQEALQTPIEKKCSTKNN